MTRSTLSRIIIPILFWVFFSVGVQSGARAADAPPSLAGTYRNDRIILTLEADAGADAYRGTLDTGGQSFRIAAQLANAQLAGTFADNAGNAFEFTAGPNQYGLIFTTANTPYQLINDNQRPVRIGIQLKQENGVLVIERTTPGAPAARAGVQAGDVLTAVDGAPVGKDVLDATQRIRGKLGTPVKLTISRNGHAVDFTIVRERLLMLLPDALGGPIAPAPALEAPPPVQPPQPMQQPVPP